MNYQLMPVMSIDELETAVNLQFSTNIDLRDTLFGYDYYNDSYKPFNFLEDHENDEYNLVCTYLRDTLGSQYDTILLDVS